MYNHWLYFLMRKYYKYNDMDNKHLIQYHNIQLNKDKY